MVKRTKRHTASEIAAKLDDAAARASRGQTQVEIARALGVSVMTFHRWRKAMPQAPHRMIGQPSAATPGAVARHAESQRQVRLAELQAENLRLRKLVADLLLEKMRLEDEVGRFGGTQTRRNAVC